MSRSFESLCRITAFAILLRYTGTPFHVSAPLAVLTEGCGICVTGMSHFIRHVALKRVAPVTAAASITTTTPRQVVSLSHGRAVTTDSAVQTTDNPGDGQHMTTPVPRVARPENQEHLERTPKSRVHQELLRKKRQQEAGTQTEPAETAHNDIEHARLRRKYVKYRLKAAVEKVQANKLRRKYDDSELARQSLSKHVVAVEKAAEEHGSQLEAAYQEQTSTLGTKCEAMFASFEEIRAAHQSKVQEHESLLAAHERLNQQHGSVMEQINRFPPWMKLLEKDAEEWPQLKQMHSIVDGEAPVTEEDNLDYQEHGAMLWSNYTRIDAARYSDAQTFPSTTPAQQNCTSTESPPAASEIPNRKDYEEDDSKLGDERRVATNTMITTTEASESPDLASMKVESSESKQSPLSWNQQLVSQAYYDAHLANDTEEYPHATTWEVHGSICLEVGSDEDGRPRYFRFVPQVATPQAERIVPALLNECQQKLMQYVHNGLAILAGLQVPSRTGYASWQFERLPSPGKPIWLRRGRKPLPSIETGARHDWVSKTSGSHINSGSLKNPFDDCYALDSSVEPLSNVYNA